MVKDYSIQGNLDYANFKKYEVPEDLQNNEVFNRCFLSWLDDLHKYYKLIIRVEDGKKFSAVAFPKGDDISAASGSKSEGIEVELTANGGFAVTKTIGTITHTEELLIKNPNLVRTVPAIGSSQSIMDAVYQRIIYDSDGICLASSSCVVGNYLLSEKIDNYQDFNNKLFSAWVKPRGWYDDARPMLNDYSPNMSVSGSARNLDDYALGSTYSYHTSGSFSQGDMTIKRGLVDKEWHDALLLRFFYASRIEDQEVLTEAAEKIFPGLTIEQVERRLTEEFFDSLKGSNVVKYHKDAFSALHKKGVELGVISSGFGMSGQGD